MPSEPPATFTETDAALVAADCRYLERDWAAALALYERLCAADPTAVQARALAVGIGHCRVELAAADALDALPLEHAPCPDSPRRTVFVLRARHRALEMCDAGEARRAARLLRFLAGFDDALGATYKGQILAGRSAHPSAPVDAVPGFLAATGLTDDAVAAAKERHRGRRILAAHPRYLARSYEVSDNLMRAARAFGLEVQEFNVRAAEADPDTYASALLAAIVAFRPEVVYFADLFENDASAFVPAVREQVAEVLALARSNLGVRVVRYLQDGWRTAVRVGSDLYAELGRAVDLVVHQYPCVLGIGDPAQRARVFCYPTPCHLPVSTVEVGALPRACFTGRMHEWAYPRVVWWAESIARGLPIDWRVQLPWDTAQKLMPPASDQAYADQLRGYAVSLSLVSRLNGARIMPGRTLETLMVGGTVLEERAPDTTYFLQPGRHYLTFETLDDLAETLPALIADRPRRLALADAGHRWVEKYFTGDYFWAGLLDKLAALG